MQEIPIQFQVSRKALLYQQTIFSSNCTCVIIMSSRIIDFGLIILFLMLSVRFSALFPCTSPSTVDSQPTTTSQPINESLCNNTDTSEGAIREIGGCNCTWNDSENCTSLPQAIYDLYDSIDVNADIPYQFFTLKDLFYSAILAGGEDLRLNPPPIDANFSSRRYLLGASIECNRLKGRYNFPTSDTEDCKWDYNCTQKLNQFPSFYLVAELSTPNTGSCTPIVIRNKRFVRTTCVGSNSTPHWLSCDCGEVVVGFKHS